MRQNKHRPTDNRTNLTAQKTSTHKQQHNSRAPSNSMYRQTLHERSDEKTNHVDADICGVHTRTTHSHYLPLRLAFRIVLPVLAAEFVPKLNPPPSPPPMPNPPPPPPPTPPPPPNANPLLGCPNGGGVVAGGGAIEKPPNAAALLLMAAGAAAEAAPKSKLLPPPPCGVAAAPNGENAGCCCCCC